MKACELCVPQEAVVQKRGIMGIKKKIAAALGILAAVLVSGSVSSPVYAEQNRGEVTENLNGQDPVVFTYGEDGLVDGRKEFVIPAAAGENYDIEITFAGNGADSVMSFAYDRVTEDQMVPNTDSAASDRSGLLEEKVREGEQQTRTFAVAAIEGDITIQATGKGRVLSIRAVRQAAKAPNEKKCIYTVGDSLVQTYGAKYAPQTGWGQTLPLYFDENVTFVNRALGGRSTGNYLRQGRLNQVLCEIAPGDCVLIEFGHNDAGSGNKDRYVSVADYKKLLADVYIKAIRDRGATPVLVTLCNRNQYARTNSEFIVSFPEYVEAMRETAAETGTLLIDLNAITVDRFTELNQRLGPGITKDIIYNHAIAGAYEGEYAKGVRDDTHLQYYGAKLVGGYVAEELHKLELQGISEHYVPLETPKEAPGMPEGIAEKKYGNFVSRITWTPCEGADYYKVMAAELVSKDAQGEAAKDGAETAGGSAVGDGAAAQGSESDGDTASDVYELVGEFEIIGYTTVCDFANMDAEKDKHYAYKVTAINAAGESPESEIFTFGLRLASGDEPEDSGADSPAASAPQQEQKPESGRAQSSMVIAIIVLAVAAAAAVAIGVLARNKGKK